MQEYSPKHYPSTLFTVVPKKKTVKVDSSAADGTQLALIDAGALQQNIGFAVGSMERIEGSASDAAAQVKAQEALYTEMRRGLLGKYGRWADLVTAAHFGVEVSSELWTPLSDYATGRTITTLPQIARYLDDAETIARRDRFFHWELEFPEIYFDHDGEPLGEQAGFDVVIGNPPYVRQEQFAPFKPFLQLRYKSFHGVADLYLYFYEQGLNMTRQNGRMAYISSGTFARANFAAPFRAMLPTRAQIRTLIDFGENQPFTGAEMVRPSIVVMQRGVSDSSFRSLFLAEKIPQSLTNAVVEQGIDCDPAALMQSEWTFQLAAATLLAQKLLAAGTRLIEAVGGKLFYGVKTGLNEAFIIDQETRDRLVAADSHATEIIRQVLQGEDLRPWYQESEGRWLITFPFGWTTAHLGSGLTEIQAYTRLQERHPGIAAHLKPFAEAARRRSDQGQYWWELRACAYYDAFDKPKIFWPEISKLPRFSYDNEGKYINNSGHFTPLMDWSLLGVLQSRVTWFAISQIAQPLRLRAGLWQYQLFDQFLSRLPIPNMTEDEREVVGGLAMAITEQARARYDLHEKTRRRIVNDLGVPGVGLNQKLTAWWTLDFAALRRELQKVFKRDILLKERDEWEEWLGARKSEHLARTSAIVGLETELNARVYALFHLSPDEIALIEASTKYAYGEV